MTVTGWLRGDTLRADDLDEAFGNSVDKRGDVMAGLLTLARDPVGSLDAVTKQYVDNAVVTGIPGGMPYLPITGGTLTGPLTVGGILNSSTRPGRNMFDTFIGDTSRAWFTGGQWGFGQRPTTTTAPADTGPALVVQRNPSYTGAQSGNPSALVVLNSVGSGVTGLENSLVAQLNIAATSGVYTSGTVAGFKNAAGSSLINLNVNSQDRSGRMSSVSGSNVPCEFDLWASGPDDSSLRHGIDMIVGEYQPSSDGATTFTTAGPRIRGREFRVVSSGALSVPTFSTIGSKVATVSEIGQGYVGSFGVGYSVDQATVAAFNASSAVQSQHTNASALAGATTLTFVTSNQQPTYIWPGSLVTGTNIAPNTHVVSSSYDNNVTVTVVLDTPTSGAIANNAAITFTNKIQVGYLVTGYIAGNAFQSPGFSIDPVGNLTVAGTTITGFGTSIGQALGPLANFQSSGHPGLTMADRLIFQRGSPTATDFADLQLNRVTTSVTSVLSSQLNAALRVTTTIGASDGTQEYGIISQVIGNGTNGGLGYAGFFTSQKQVGATDPHTGANLTARDANAGPSSANGGGVVGAEITVGGNRADDQTNGNSFGGHGVRKGIHLSAVHATADGQQAEISHGIWIGTTNPAGNAVDTQTNFDSVIGFLTTTQIRIALDTRGVSVPVGSTDPISAVTMPAGQIIDFNGSASLTSNPGGAYLQYRSGTGRFYYVVAGVDMWSVDGSGNVRAKGTITGSTTP